MMLIILLLAYLASFPKQEAETSAQANLSIASDSEGILGNCSLPAAQRAALLGEAEKNNYAVRIVEFSGNAHTPHYVLQRRFLLLEGDPFIRSKLTASIKRLSKLKMIKPVRPIDVGVRLDRPNKIVDLTICIREKRLLAKGH